MVDKTLSKEAIDVLRKIHNRGLWNRSSYGVEHPVYGKHYENDDFDGFEDDDLMPPNEWGVVWSELCTIEREKIYITTHEEKGYTRIVTRNGAKFKEDVLVFDSIDGKPVREYIVRSEQELSSTLPVVNSQEGHEEILNVWGNCDGYWSTLESYSSELLDTTPIEMSDFYEEKIGLIYKYTLTDKALNLINRKGGE